MRPKLYDFNSGIREDWLGFDGVLTALSPSDYKKSSGVIGVEIEPRNTDELRRLVKKYGKADFITLKTNVYEVKRAAVDKALVDVITSNEAGTVRSKRNYLFAGVDQVIAKACADNHVSVNVRFRDFLKASDKGLVLGRMRQNVKLCLKYGVPMIVSSGARKKSEAVPADNLISFAQFLGMNRNQAVKSLSAVAQKIIKRKGARP